MTLVDLAGPPPAAWAAAGSVYLLGVGGPEDEAGIGDVGAFVWRFAVAEAGDGPAVALAFSAMPRLMRFTRAVNAAAPFSVPTEALRVDAASLDPAAGVRVALDPEADDLAALGGAPAVRLRRVPLWSGDAP